MVSAAASRAALVAAFALGVVLLVVGGQQLAAALLRLPAGHAVGLASLGLDITRPSFDRATTALERSLVVLNRPASQRETGVLHQNLGRQSLVERSERQQLYDAALAAFDRSMRYSPVEPVASLLAAQIHYERGARREAAAALEWSLRTGLYLRPHAVPRSYLALALWEHLGEATKERLGPSIRSTLAGDLETFAAWTVAFDADEDLSQRLVVLGPDDETMVERFLAAVAVYREDRQTALASLEMTSAMRGLMLTTALLVSAQVPLPGQAMTIADYLAVSRGDPSTDVTTNLDDYLIGVLDGLVMLSAANEQQDAALFCLPEQAVIEVDMQTFRRDLDTMLAQFEAEMPNFAQLARTRTVGLAALQLLTMRHPCDE